LHLFQSRQDPAFGIQQLDLMRLRLPAAHHPVFLRGVRTQNLEWVPVTALRNGLETIV
jgi:hypothetical protein